jgi:putative transposase
VSDTGDTGTQLHQVRKSSWRSRDCDRTVVAMARRYRELEVDGYYHAHPHANGDGVMFHDDIDRLRHVELFTTAAKRHKWTVLGYCQMTTHWHFVVQLPELGLSEGMQWLQSQYARRWNRRHDQKGHLFLQHFGGKPIVYDSHLRSTLRYVDLNPLAIDGVTAPEDWPWSSYRAHVGLEHPPAYLDLPAFHRLFGTTPGEAGDAYKRFVSEGHDPVSDTGFEDPSCPTHTRCEHG